MSSLPGFRISRAAKLAGVSTAVIRAWEKRYGLLAPTRTAAGYRVYSPEDVEVLRGAAALVAAGHSIGEAARRPREELRAVARRPEASEPTSPSPAADGPTTLELAIDRALAAARELDRERFESALLAALDMGALTPADACDRLLLPLLRRIGDEWAVGRLDVAAEHFAASVVRAKLLRYLDYLPRPADGPLVVCACPDEERHELGLLAFAVHAASSGWRTVVLGAGTPLADAIGAAVRLKADLLALALTMNLGAVARHQLAASLAHGRAVRPLRVLAGGPAAERDADFLATLGIEVASSFRPALRTAHS